MSDFLVNLVRRGAGLPATTIQAPPASPFGPEIRKDADRSIEEPVTGGSTSAFPLPMRSSESVELPFKVSTHGTPSIQRFSAAESMGPNQPAIGESVAAAGTPPLRPPPALRGEVIPDKRVAEVAPVQPPVDSDTTTWPFHAHHEVITGIDAEGGRHPMSPIAHAIDLTGDLAGEADSAEPDPPITRDGAWKTRGPALAAPTIRPGIAESHSLFDVRRIPTAPSPALPAQIPIHVRIGRVEVRAAPAPTPTPAVPRTPAPVGFERYRRVRNYRS